MKYSTGYAYGVTIQEKLFRNRRPSAFSSGRTSPSPPSSPSSQRDQKGRSLLGDKRHETLRTKQKAWTRVAQRALSSNSTAIHKSKQWVIIPMYGTLHIYAAGSLPVAATCRCWQRKPRCAVPLGVYVHIHTYCTVR